MTDTIYHGGPVHRGRTGKKNDPPTGELSGAAREIVRFLEGTDGQALMTEISGNLAQLRRSEIDRAVEQLVEAGIVTTDAGFGEPVVRLQGLFNEAIEGRPVKD